MGAFAFWFLPQILHSILRGPVYAALKYSFFNRTPKKTDCSVLYFMLNNSRPLEAAILEIRRHRGLCQHYHSNKRENVIHVTFSKKAAKIKGALDFSIVSSTLVNIE